MEVKSGVISRVTLDCYS